MTNSWKWFTAEEIASWPTEHKKCRLCQEVLPLSSFGKNKSKTLFGVNTMCKECRKPKSRHDWEVRTPRHNLLYSARHRAKNKGLACDIDLSDIVIPEICPILKVPINTDGRNPYGPSLDRIVPERGYTKGNVQVISKRANTLKNNMTLEELRLLSEWFESKFAT